MQLTMNILGLILILLLTFSCRQKAFPDEYFTFSSKYRDLISPYKIGDSLVFAKNNGGIIRIQITSVDSIISNSKGGLMSLRPYKDIAVFCKYLDYHKTTANDTTLVFINNYPDSLELSCYFAIMNFRGSITEQTDSIISEFKPVPGKVFKNCFVVKNYARDLGEGPDDIQYIYVQQTQGIIALKTYDGEWWMKR